MDRYREEVQHFAEHLADMGNRAVIIEAPWDTVPDQGWEDQTDGEWLYRLFLGADTQGYRRLMILPDTTDDEKYEENFDPQDHINQIRIISLKDSPQESPGVDRNTPSRQVHQPAPASSVVFDHAA